MNPSATNGSYTSLLRGVVLRAAYGSTSNGSPPRYDVAVYDGHRVGRSAILQNVELTYDFADMHDGDVVLPRPSTNLPADLRDMNVGRLNGSHVLIGFLQGSGQPVILRYLLHPKSDVGKQLTEPFGSRVQALDGDASDGDRPRVLRYKGVQVSISGTGEVVVDTTQSRTDYTGDTDTPDPGTAVGSVTVRVRGDADVVVEGGHTRLRTSTVELGTSPTHAVAWGDVVDTIHTTYDTALDRFVSALVTALGSLPAPLTGAAVGSAIQTAYNTAKNAGLRLSAQTTASSDVSTR